MTCTILTGIALFLISGKLWVGFIGLLAGAAATIYFRNKVGDFVEKKGGIEDARVLKQICYNDDGKVVYPEDREYTVVVKYRNGERLKYTLRGNTALFRKLRPYISN